MNQFELSRLDPATLIIAGVFFLASFSLFIIWIITLVKQFRAGETVWGVITLFAGMLGLVWCFLRNHTLLGVCWFLLTFVAVATWIPLVIQYVALMEQM